MADGVVVPVVDDGVMKRQRRVIIGVGLVVTAALAVAALLFGLRGVEAASWLAGVASLVVAVAAMVLARPSAQLVSPADPVPRGPVKASGKGSVAAGENISGIASTGDDAINIQRQ
jgi:hypothetical protein